MVNYEYDAGAHHTTHRGVGLFQMIFSFEEKLMTRNIKAKFVLGDNHLDVYDEKHEMLAEVLKEMSKEKK